MEKYIIAGKKTAYYVRGKLLKQRSKDYKADFSDDEIQIKLRIKKAFIDAKKEEIPNLSWEEHEYMWTCQAFYSELLRWNGVMLHASCVEKDGFAYLFSAPSGTGKSTHTHLWLEHLENTRIINDDKPALTLENGRWFANGTPFSGKTDENINTSAPVRAVVFLKRGEENKVRKLSGAEAVTMFLRQTIMPGDRTLAEKALELADRLLKDIPVFMLECNMSPEAARESYEGIERLIADEN